jgi:hypothetical protein
LFIPVELGVWNQAGVVVEKGKEEHLALLVGMGWVGKIGAVHSVSLPETAKVTAFEAAVRLGTLLGEKLGGGGSTLGQVTPQSTRGDTFFGDRVCLVKGKDADDRSRGAKGLLALEGFGAVKGF